MVKLWLANINLYIKKQIELRNNFVLQDAKHGYKQMNISVKNVLKKKQLKKNGAVKVIIATAQIGQKLEVLKIY